MDCTVCKYFKQTLMYYKCLFNKEHVIDDIIPICKYFELNLKKKIISKEKAFKNLMDIFNNK